MTGASVRPYLRSIPLFRFLPPDRQLAVAKKLVHARLGGGQSLDLRADHAQVLCIVSQGQVAVQTRQLQRGVSSTLLAGGQWAGQGLLLGWHQARQTTLTAGGEGADVLLLWKHDLVELAPFGALADMVHAVNVTRSFLPGARSPQPALVGVVMALALFVAFVLFTQPGRTLHADWRYWWHRSNLLVPTETKLNRLARVLELCPDHAFATVELGNLVAQSGDIKTAMGWYESILGDSGSGANNLAVLLLGQREPAAALDALAVSIDLEPDMAITYQNQGLAYQQLDRRDAALGSFREALRIDPDLVPARYHLGLDYLSHQDYIKAGAAFELVLEREPTCAPAYLGLGLVYQELGDSTRAIDAFCHATQLAPASWTVQFQLARAQSKAGRSAEARATLLKVLEQHPPPDIVDRVRSMLAEGTAPAQKEASMNSGP